MKIHFFSTTVRFLNFIVFLIDLTVLIVNILKHELEYE
jgi:hypothetical protein